MVAVAEEEREEVEGFACGNGIRTSESSSFTVAALLALLTKTAAAFSFLGEFFERTVT